MRGQRVAKTSIRTKLMTAKDQKAVTLQADVREMTQLHLQGTFGRAEHDVLGNANIKE